MTTRADFVQFFLDLLPSQLGGKPYITALLGGVLDEIRATSEMLDALSEGMLLDNMEGVQLDGMGFMHGVPRSGMNDVDYLAAIKAQMAINRGSGTGPDISNALAIITNAVRILSWELFPAGVFYFTHFDVLPANLYNSMKRVVAAGVSLFLVVLASDVVPFYLGAIDTDDASVSFGGATMSVIDTDDQTIDGPGMGVAL